MKKILNSLNLMYKTFKEVISAHPFAGIVYPILKTIEIFVNIYNIFVMGQLLDSMINYLGENDTFVISEFLKSEVFSVFIMLMLLLFLRRFVGVAEDHMEAMLYDFFWYKFRKDNIAKLATLNLEDIEKSKLQNLLTNVNNHSFNATWDTYIRTIDLINNIINLWSAGAIIVTQMAWWGLAVMLFVLPEALVRHSYNLKLKEYLDKNMEKQKYFDYLYREALIIENFPELRVDNVFDFFRQSFERTSQPYYQNLNKDIRRKRDTWHFLLSWFDGSLMSVMQILLIPISVAQRFTIGTFKYLYDYIANLYSASWHALWNFLVIQFRLLFVQDYFDLKDYKGFGDIDSGTTALHSLSIPKIEFVNVSFKYPNTSSEALNDVSFTVEPGEKAAIIGYDNSGKSTIAKLLSGLYKVGPGDILLNNVSISQLKRGELKDRIAVVFEHYVKYNFSIRKNITLSEPLRDFNRRKYEETLEITGLNEWMKESGLQDTQILGKLFSSGMDISSGYWQRIAIARALYRDRAILVLDESLTQIDSFSRKPLLQGIINYRPKQTLINITQEEDGKDIFDKVIYLEKGRITKVENHPHSHPENNSELNQIISKNNE